MNRQALSDVVQKNNYDVQENAIRLWRRAMLAELCFAEVQKDIRTKPI